jgi:hypothetical protein
MYPINPNNTNTGNTHSADANRAKRADVSGNAKIIADVQPCTGTVGITDFTNIICLAGFNSCFNPGCNSNCIACGNADSYILGLFFF